MNNAHSWRYILASAYSSRSVLSTFRWTSIVFLLLSIVIYVFATKYGHFTSSLPLTIESIILVMLLTINTATIFWNSKMRFYEIFNKASILCNKIEQYYQDDQLIQLWSTGNFFPERNTPTSPCISLQWTYRDDKLVNLPTQLLVQGDVILLNPGRVAPANCRKIEKIVHREKTFSELTLNERERLLRGDYDYLLAEGKNAHDNSLTRGEIYVVQEDSVPETFSVPRLRKAVKPRKFLVTETPYIRDLKIALNSYAQHKAPSAFEKELRLIFVQYLEHILVPCICVLVFLFSLIHYLYVELNTIEDAEAASLVLICLRPIMAILPLLPLALPVLWQVLNVYGLVKLYIVHKNFTENELQMNDNYLYLQQKLDRKNHADGDSFVDLENDLNQSPNDLFIEDIDLDKLKEAFPKQDLSLMQVLKELYTLIFKPNDTLWRTTNLLHVFGSITALCCTDKKGIISWPNPTADKVFFLTSSTQNKKKGSTNSESKDNEGDGDKEASRINEISPTERGKRQCKLVRCCC